jgi:transposase
VSHDSTLARKIQPQEYEVFVGMDVDKRSIVLTQVDHLGQERSVRMPHEGPVLLSYLARHLRGRRVALVYEAGPTGFGLYDTLSQAGYPCLVVTPSSVPKARGRRVRTNRLDAVQLARQLRGGDLEGIRVPSGDYRMLRELVQLRKQHMTEAARDKQRIKALFLRYSLEFPVATPGGYWSQEAIRRLREYPCAPALQFKLRSLLSSLEFARGQAAQAQAELRRFVQARPELAASVGYAMSLPGVGWIVATYAVARIGDWRLLGKSPEMASFFGLTQCEDSTGEDANRGSITKAGDPVMRALLIEGAWTAIRKDAELRRFFERVKARQARDKASCIAIVAVARKLACRLHCVLKERREYQLRTEME